MGTVARLLGLPYAPITPTFPLARPARPDPAAEQVDHRVRRPDPHRRATARARPTTRCSSSTSPTRCARPSSRPSTRCSCSAARSSSDGAAGAGHAHRASRLPPVRRGPRDRRAGRRRPRCRVGGAVGRQRPRRGSSGGPTRCRSPWSTVASTTTGGSTRPGCAPPSRATARATDRACSTRAGVRRLTGSGATLCRPSQDRTLAFSPAGRHAAARTVAPYRPRGPAKGVGDRLCPPQRPLVGASPRPRWPVCPEYLRALTRLRASGHRLGLLRGARRRRRCGSAKLRKDLSHLGSYGVRGVGYDVEHLAYEISLGPRPHPGLARGHRRDGQPRPGARRLPRLRRAGLPDRRAARRRPALVGERSPACGCARWPTCRRSSPTTAWPSASSRRPRRRAQAVCDDLVGAGVRSILNFAPAVLAVPDGVDVRKVDLSTELQILAFHAQRKSLAARDLRGGVAR